MDNRTGLLHAIIVDDEKRGISALKQLIEKFTDDVKIVAECLKASAAVELIESMRPEIVFLDINMPGMNGFEMLDELSWKSFNLVFTTAHPEYALKALKNNAVDYLLKPINHHELITTVKRIRRKLSENKMVVSFNYTELLNSIAHSNKSRLLINSISGVEHINLDDVICLESQSNYTKIILVNGQEIIARKTMKDFERQLCFAECDFMRVHKSYIISLSKVSQYLKNSSEIVLTRQIRVPLSKARKEIFYSWLDI